ncbi:response regulator [candidate division CSSED10-310 bacterium]|uniref:Response regulator n=1 Tax=candidate division CSSED10-310 bacterium TaxID=2855610 RepID=A0ABV6YUC5_UNCC1
MKISGKKVGKLLLVDDEKFILALLQDILRDIADVIITAHNGREGLKKVKTEKPDIVISDVMMPEMNGYQFLQAVRESPETMNLPFILLTVKDQPVDIKRGRAFKADYYFTKPFDQIQLIKAIEELASTL